jgi:hypothetical protein
VLAFSSSLYNHSDAEKNRVEVVQLPVIWAKSHVIANKQLTLVLTLDIMNSAISVFNIMTYLVVKSGTSKHDGNIVQPLRLVL